MNQTPCISSPVFVSGEIQAAETALPLWWDKALPLIERLSAGLSPRLSPEACLQWVNAGCIAFVPFLSMAGELEAVAFAGREPIDGGDMAMTLAVAPNAPDLDLSGIAEILERAALKNGSGAVVLWSIDPLPLVQGYEAFDYSGGNAQIKFLG